MSDSRRLHASCLSVLQSELSGEDFRRLDTWAWAITGLLLQKTISLPAWICHLPDEADAFGREQRFRRWLNNRAVKVNHFISPSSPKLWGAGQGIPCTLVLIPPVWPTGWSLPVRLSSTGGERFP